MNTKSTHRQIGISTVITLMGLAILGFILVRFLFLPSAEYVHYHANFQVWIEGKQVPFDDDRYYEGIVACDTESYKEPGFRTHMHKPDNDLVHVHADGVTWGHFFEVVGYDVSDKAIVTANRVLAPNGDDTITFVLNGEETGTIANKVIGDEDVLLVNYGSESISELQEISRGIPVTAGDYNEVDDPATCSGGEEQGWRERLRKAVWN